MTNEEIARFKIAIINNKDVYWRSVDGDVHKVVGFHPDYKEMSDDIGEPVALLSRNLTVALYNCEVEEFIEVKPLQI